MTRTSAEIVLLSIPIFEPHCQRAKIYPLRTEKRPSELGDYPWG